MTDRFTPPPPEPLGLGGVMRATLTVYRVAPLPFLLVALVSTIPASVLLIGSDITYGSPGGHVQGLAQRILPVLPDLLLGQLSIAASAVMVMHMFHGLPPRAGIGLERVGEHFWVLAAVVLVTTIGIAIGLVAFILPAIYLLVVWLFAPMVTVTEQRSLRDALRRSAGVVRGHFWWVLGSWLAIQITVVLGALVITDLISIPVSLTNGTLAIVLRGLGAFVALTLLTPVANIGVVMIYMDLRVRETPLWPLPPMRYTGADD